jgi:tetratricopeptide (TPR) repeat protein
MSSTFVPALTRLVIVLLLTLTGARVASADDVATRAAKRHYARGEKLFNLGKFEDALDEFEKAYDAKPIPDFLFNIGQCHRNLGDYDSAIFSFKKFLKLDPDAPNREKVQSLIDELEAKQERDDTDRFRLVKKPREQPVTTESPVYKKWWFWTGVAVVGVAGGVGIYTATRSGGPPDTDLGLLVFGK